MTTYEMGPERGTVHGSFSRERPAALTIDAGDTVRYATLDAGWNVEPRTSLDPRDRPRTFGPRDPDRDRVHALLPHGVIEGARPSMAGVGQDGM